MRVNVLYFAVLRERLRSAGEPLDLPEGTAVSDAVAAIAKAHPDVARLLGGVQVAVNREMVARTHRLSGGDELALIPPVSGGGSPRRIALLAEPLALSEVVAAVEGPEQGGVVTFVGNVRRQGQMPDVVRLEYEAYAQMALEVLTGIADEIERETPGVRVAIHHRTGTLLVGHTAVIIAAAAPHRAQAFAACREAIERVKARAPIWKKEIGEGGDEWVGMGP